MLAFLSEGSNAGNGTIRRRGFLPQSGKRPSAGSSPTVDSRNGFDGQKITSGRGEWTRFLGLGKRHQQEAPIAYLTSEVTSVYRGATREVADVLPWAVSADVR